MDEDRCLGQAQSGVEVATAVAPFDFESAVAVEVAAAKVATAAAVVAIAEVTAVEVVTVEVAAVEVTAATELGSNVR